jgi:hypothetical protein
MLLRRGDAAAYAAVKANVPMETVDPLMGSTVTPLADAARKLCQLLISGGDGGDGMGKEGSGDDGEEEEGLEIEKDWESDDEDEDERNEEEEEA